MHLKRIILNSIREAFALVLKNKAMFALLLALQIAFLVIFLFLTSVYQLKILENARAISDYLSQQRLDEISVAEKILQQKPVLGDDPLSISRNFNEMLKNFRLYLIYSFILIVVFMSFSWAMTNKLVHKANFGRLTKNFLKISIVLLFYLGLIFSFFFLLFNISFADIAQGSRIFAKYIPLLFFSMGLMYFMFVSLSLLHKTGLKNIVQRTLSIGIRKMHYILSAYFINIVLLGFSIFLFIYFIEKNLFILLLSIMLISFSFVFGRVFMSVVVGKLEKN